MKKILVLIFAFAMIVIVACNQYQTSDQYVQKSIPWESATPFTYNGHQYIKFAAAYRGATVHDPECEMKDIRKILDEKYE